MKKIPALLLISLFVHTLIAQNKTFYTTYDWEENPKYQVTKDENRDIIGHKSKVVTEFYFNAENSLTEYFLEHRVIWLNSDDKIEEFNKIYLPYSSDSKLLVSKARVINKGGKVQELDKSKILTAEDEETKRQYKYFAFEGVTKGSFIEYLYVVEKYPSYTGKRVSLQSSYDKTNVDFDLYAPSNLVFRFKSYNGLKEVEYDSISKEKRHWHLHIDNIKGLKEEEKSSYDALRKFIVYKLYHNTYSNKYNISSYDKISENFYSYYHKELSKKQITGLKKLMDEVGVSGIKDHTGKIRAVENFVKTNFYLSDINDEAYEDLETILANKVANEDGMIKLYTALFRQLNIPYEIVLTSDRSELKFDKDFEAYNFLTDYLIYFPETELYMSPEAADSRLGFPPPFLTDNYGLFIKEVSVGSFKSGLGEIKYIAPAGYKETYDNMLMNVSFDKEDMTITHLDLDRSIAGYAAVYVQPFMNFIKAEDRDELTDQFVKSIHKDIEIKSKKLHNAAPEFFGVKPFKVTAKASSDYFVQKAGNKYLFKVGELIGPQIEMYQEKTRMLPVEEDHKRSYHRVITVELPQGYTINNPDAINIDNAYEKDGKELFYFKSFYRIEGNKIIITADEYYNLNIVDVELYEKYRKVINSAADFNKITLVLAPATN